MDSYSELKKLDLTPFFSEEPVTVSLMAKGIMISNPTASELSVVATVKTPGGGTTTVTLDILGNTTRIVKLKISELNAGTISAQLNIFELY
jgi:hypothetical protein